MKYLNEIWNVFDCTSPFFYIMFLALRIKKSYESEQAINIIKDYDNITEANQLSDIFIRVLCLGIMFQAFMKSMFFLRVNEDFGHLVQLVFNCLYDV